MTSKNLTPRRVTLPRRALTSAEFSQLADVPPETEWFANIDNPHTRRAYRNDLKEFMTFAGIRTPVELRLITRAHVIAWRKDLDRRQLAAGSIRRKLSALASLYEFLTDQNAVPTNPVKGVKRPKVDSYEGKTPAIADKEARQLMNLPNDKSLKGLRDRALLATLLYHGLRREELCRLKIKDIHPRRGVPHLRVHGKGNKTRCIPLHAGTPGPSETISLRIWISMRPLRTKKKSSVSSCLCQTNSPLTLTTIRSFPLNCPTTRGCQCSENVDSLSARLIASTEICSSS